MSWSQYRAHFEANARRNLPTLPPACSDVPVAMRAPLAACLARCQRGERGGQRIARQIDHVHIDGIDDDYRRALKLFLGEEARHAELLAQIVRGLGGKLLDHNWTHSAFVILRNLFGVRCKIFVLNVAEVIGIGCYGLLVDRLPPGPTRAALQQIASDETHHLAFHSDLFARRGVGAAGWLRNRALSLAWNAIGLFASTSAVIDHGAAMSALGVTRRALFARLREVLHDGDLRMTSALPSVAGCEALS